MTSNETLRQWLPKLDKIDELLVAPPAKRTSVGIDGKDLIRVVYQNAQPVIWGDASSRAAGRTLEEAFALQNLAWSQQVGQKQLQLGIRGHDGFDLEAMRTKIFTKVRNLDKTKFALALMQASPDDWEAPGYIAEGLQWLRDRLNLVAEEGVQIDA